MPTIGPMAATTTRRAQVVFISLVLVAGTLAFGAAPAESQPFTCKGLPATHVGTNGDDVIEGTEGRDVIVARLGHDTIYGYGGNDVICAGHGRDVVWAGAGDDVVDAGSNHDQVHGGPGNDQLTGERGDDTLWGDAGNDIVLGGGGRRDSAIGGADRDVCRAELVSSATCETDETTQPRARRGTKTTDMRRLKVDLVDTKSAKITFFTTECTNVRYQLRGGDIPDAFSFVVRASYPKADKPGKSCFHDHIFLPGVWTEALQPGSRYTVNIKTVDRFGRSSTATRTFTTLTPGRPPAISGQSVSQRGDTAVVSFSTNECTNARVVGTTTLTASRWVAQGAEYPVATAGRCRTTHSFSLGGSAQPLLPSADYQFEVTAVDIDGETATEFLRLTTAATNTGPRFVKGPTIVSKTATSALITFSTDTCTNGRYEASAPGRTTRIHQGDEYPKAETPEVNCWTDHYARLGEWTDPLSPNTLYSVKITAVDGQRREVSTTINLRTDAGVNPPGIFNLGASAITDSRTTVSFSTSECTNFEVHLVSTTAEPQLVRGPGFPSTSSCHTRHSVRFGTDTAPLEPNAAYIANVTVVDRDGERAIGQYEFRTTGVSSAPTFNNDVRVSGVTRTTAVINFSTPTCTNARYWATAAGAPTVRWNGIGWPAAVTKHVNCWNEHEARFGDWTEPLRANTTYNVEIELIDSGGRTTQTNVSFTTAR